MMPPRCERPADKFEATGEFANAVPPRSAGAVPGAAGRNTSWQVTSYGMASPKVKQNYEKRHFAACEARPCVRFCRRLVCRCRRGCLLFERAAFLNVVHLLNSVAF